VILTVTPNPALDLTWHVPCIEPAQTHRVPAARSRAGGKGLNVARVALAQGSAVLALTTVGGAVGAEFATELRASGIPNRLIAVAAETRRSMALVDEAAGDTTIFNEHGTNPTDAEWEALLTAARQEARSASVLAVSGSLPPQAPEGLIPALVGIARGRGIPSIVDTSGPAVLLAAEAGADVLKPNRAELREATGLDDPIAGASVLIDRGAGLVLVSLGADGMLALSADAPGRAIRARLPESLSGNPTGAGDAAVAAVAVLLDRGIRDPDQLLRAATAWSAAAVLTPLAGEISPDHPDLARRVGFDAFAAHPTDPTEP
jgi:1-phosphofructokinase family hexose kinase